MNNEKYTKVIDFLSAVCFLLIIGFLGFTFASIFFITFGNHRIFSWQTYRHIAQYVIVVISGLYIIGRLINLLNRSQ